MALKAADSLMRAFHDSRDMHYRSPSGACPAGGRVVLRLRADDPQARAQLRAWWDGAEYLYEMTRQGDLFEVELALPDHPGLWWYFFIVEQCGQTFYYGNAHDRFGGQGAVYTGEPPSFQLTVYDPDYKTPEWLRRGLMYQIMVDRFHKSEAADQRPRREDARYHVDWHESPILDLNLNTTDNRADDFFGGDLLGIVEKLPYLEGLGVTALYLNPIFQAHSNHKYDVGDYRKIDPSFGTEQDFTALCAEAEKRGIRVILDGVFSHTGHDSVYFNRYGTYDSLGAYQSKQSPYFDWYSFTDWPDKYDSWWGFETLPNVNELSESFMDYIVGAEDSVIAHWMRGGAAGWRLDVADELPMEFLRALRRRVKAENPQAALIGEVWEDASNKIAYDEHRSYCLGDTLDGAMNYPLRDGLFAFLTGHIDAHQLKRRLDCLYENYPKEFSFSMMNLLGSHDKPRSINVLSEAQTAPRPRNERRDYRLTDAQYALGARRFAAAWKFLCAMPGIPCLYYGDEAGAQGDDDPFCRGTYPWGREDKALLLRIRAANRIRRGSEPMLSGDLVLIAPCDDVLAALRWTEYGEWALCALNRSDAPQKIRVTPEDAPEAPLSRPITLTLEPQSALVRSGKASPAPRPNG